MKILDASEFDVYWKNQSRSPDGEAAEAVVREIIETVRREGDAALHRYAARFDKSSPGKLEVPAETAAAALEQLRRDEPELAAALELAAGHIRDFALEQRKQFTDFETEIAAGVFTGQKIIPVESAAVYVPAGRSPLFSSVLMGMIPALAAGTGELILTSPPMEDGIPDRRILAAAALAKSLTDAAGADKANPANLRIFALGGAQAIAALALGTESVPRVGVIVGPGNKYVAAAKRILFGQVGIDFVAGPTDVLVIAGEAPGREYDEAISRIAADMLAQAEHDPDARARALVPGRKMAEAVLRELERQLEMLPEFSGTAARSSLDAGGLIIVYQTQEDVIRIANAIAPEHLELHLENASEWAGKFRNYGSLFIGPLSAEVLGDYSAGINHTLPTSGSARFTGGLSVRHFLKTVTTLRCVPGPGFEEARKAAEILGHAENLAAHAESARIRKIPSDGGKA